MGLVVVALLLPRWRQMCPGKWRVVVFLEVSASPDMLPVMSSRSSMPMNSCAEVVFIGRQKGVID
jgi:hypothetical protein